ncbi:MAG: PASTA domain-containing protein [Thermoanaerobaculales bacterium]|nr:PASTA domain-containing protein [Thermoanaerobaculales bacterium]
MNLRAKFLNVMARLLVVGAFLLAAGVVSWFSLVFTVHLGTVAVPELRGATQEEADRLAHDLGLVMDVDQSGVFSATIPADKIAFQRPLPGFHLKAGSTVTVRLSLGDEQLEVPDIGEESLRASIRILEGIGLRPGLKAEISGQGGGDALLATSPGLGAKVAPGTEVDLLMNRAPKQQLWVMPSLLSQRIGVVRTFTQANRLRLGRVHDVDYPGLQAGLILRQYPPSGSPVSRSDIITLWISK